MDTAHPVPEPSDSPVTTLSFLGRVAETDEALAGLAPEASGALRAFSLQRLMAYGLAYADAVELRSHVFGGAGWQAAATELAHTALARAGAVSRSVPSRIADLRRASALLRTSQVMMTADTDERRGTYAKAAELFEQAATLAGTGRAVLVETTSGPLAGWWYDAVGDAVGSAIVLGGVDGWAMDFACQGEALASRGVDTLVLDGPGQGESRFAHRHYLDAAWPEALRGAIDYVERRSARPGVALVGNSLGGSLALTIAAADPRVRACCTNAAVVGGAPASAGKSPNFAKMLLASGTDDEQVARQYWGRIDPFTPRGGGGYDLLIIHGAKDPAVPVSAAQTLLERAPAGHKELVVFSDGDHCMYNHRDDRDALLTDWVRSRLAN